MTYTPENGAKIYFASGSPDPLAAAGERRLMVLGGRSTGKSEALRAAQSAAAVYDPLTMKFKQFADRLHRPGKSNIQHVWIDEAASIDERVFASLARKGTEQEIRAAVTANWEQEHGKISWRTPRNEPPSGSAKRR